jgi:hypothetical protein
MVAGGVGGANTITGKYFEVATDLKSALIEAGYNLDDFIFCQQYDFARYFKKQTGLKMKDVFGKDFRPDEAVIYNNTLYVVEKKTQGTGGSVDEKIQTGPYKLAMYEECAKMLGLKGAKYIYLLAGKYFNIPKYTTHQIPWLQEKYGIPTYFDKLPLENLF